MALPSPWGWCGCLARIEDAWKLAALFTVRMCFMPASREWGCDQRGKGQGWGTGAAGPSAIASHLGMIWVEREALPCLWLSESSLFLSGCDQRTGGTCQARRKVWCAARGDDWQIAWDCLGLIKLRWTVRSTDPLDICSDRENVALWLSARYLSTARNAQEK